MEAEVNFCVFRCEQQNGYKGEGGKESWEVKVLERHEFSSQAFVPMGGGGGRYLALVALPGAGAFPLSSFGCAESQERSLTFFLLLISSFLDGADGKPDLSTLRAFLATNAQGISYHPNIWHHPIIALDAVGFPFPSFPLPPPLSFISDSSPLSLERLRH